MNPEVSHQEIDWLAQEGLTFSPKVTRETLNQILIHDLGREELVGAFQRLEK